MDIIIIVRLIRYFFLSIDSIAYIPGLYIYVMRIKA